MEAAANEQDELNDSLQWGLMGKGKDHGLPLGGSVPFLRG